MPVSVNRARVPSRGRLISSSDYRDWKTAAAWRVRLSGVRASTYPVAVEIEVHTANTRRDVDNVVKPCLDALVTGGALDDDNIAHVSAITVRARRAHTEIVVVRIQEMNDRCHWHQPRSKNTGARPRTDARGETQHEKNGHC